MSQLRIVEYRGVMVVGKTGAGKSTLANAIVRSDDRFTVSSSFSSCTSECEHCYVEVTEENASYRMKVLDTVGLFDTGPTTNTETIVALKTYVQDHFKEGMTLIIFVLQEGRFTPEEKNSFNFILSRCGEDFSSMSALVITNCDNKDEKGRSDVIQEFKSSPLTKPIAEFMKAGIYTVGLLPKWEYISFPLLSSLTMRRVSPKIKNNCGTLSSDRPKQGLLKSSTKIHFGIVYAQFYS